jgi:hypothetical protein
MKKLISLHTALLAAVAWIAFCTPSWAQGNIRTILIVRPKMDQTSNWKTTVKDFVALVKKAGSDQGFTVWESQTGPHEYAVVWYSAKWKDLGEDDPKLKPLEAERAAIFEKLDGETISLETWVDEMQPDLTIPGKQVPLFVRTGRTRVVSGKMDEVKAIFHDQIFPAVKKSGATDYGVALARFGTPTNEIHSYLGISGWGDFDSPLGVEKGMSAAEWKAFQTKFTPLVESTEWTIWKFQPDLSYVLSK